MGKNLGPQPSKCNPFLQRITSSLCKVAISCCVDPQTGFRLTEFYGFPASQTLILVFWCCWGPALILGTLWNFLSISSSSRSLDTFPPRVPLGNCCTAGFQKTQSVLKKSKMHFLGGKNYNHNIKKNKTQFSTLKNVVLPFSFQCFFFPLSKNVWQLATCSVVNDKS